MKKILLEKPFMPFLATALIATAIAVIFKGIFPQEIFDVSVFNKDYSMAQSAIWFIFAVYLFFLGAIYYIISRTKLRTKKGLVISHYSFIILFLLFFIVFSAFANPAVQRLISGVPLSTLIILYGMIFITDVAFFVFGILLLLINLLSLKKGKAK